MEILESNQVFLTPNLGANARKNLMLEDSLKSMNKNQKVFIVGICGGQGGGKTKLAKVLCKNNGDHVQKYVLLLVLRNTLP